MNLLPLEKSPPSLTPQTIKVLLYGRPGVGKTTLANNLGEETLILECEPGTGGITNFGVPVSDWQTFRDAGKELAESERFDMVVVDTVDELYRFCMNAVCEDYGVRHPSEGDYGLVWGAVNDEFRLRVGKLANMGRGTIFISHAKEVEIESRIGKHTMMVPTVAGQGYKFITGFVDLLGFMTFGEGEDGEEVRVLRTKPSSDYDAKQRGGPNEPGSLNLPDPIVLPTPDSTALIDAINEGIAK